MPSSVAARRSRSAGRCDDDDGVLLWAGPNDEAIVVNGALRTSADVSAGDLFARAETFFGARSRGHTVFCRTDTDGDLVEMCRSRGLPALAEGGLPEMVVHERVAVPAVPDGASVREVEHRARPRRLPRGVRRGVRAARCVEGHRGRRDASARDAAGRRRRGVRRRPGRCARPQSRCRCSSTASPTSTGSARCRLRLVAAWASSRPAKSIEHGFDARRRCRGAAGFADGRWPVSADGLRRAVPLRGVPGPRDVTGCRA